jgi:hypothetical protein
MATEYNINSIMEICQVDRDVAIIKLSEHNYDVIKVLMNHEFEINPITEELRDSLTEIFNDEQETQFFIKTVANQLMSKKEPFHIYSGGGDNSKSMMYKIGDRNNSKSLLEPMIKFAFGPMVEENIPDTKSSATKILD